MLEAAGHQLIQRILAGMAERRMAQVVAHGDGLRQILIEAQGPGNGSGNSGDLQGMGQAGAVMITLRVEKHLGLVHQTAKGLGMDDFVRIPLITGAHIVLLGHFATEATLGSIGKCRQRIQILMFSAFQFFPNGHCHTLLYVPVVSVTPETLCTLYRSPCPLPLRRSYPSAAPGRAAPGLPGTAIPAPPQRQTGYPG